MSPVHWLAVIGAVALVILLALMFAGDDDGLD